MKKNTIITDGTEFVIDSGMDANARKKLCKSIMQNVKDIDYVTMAMIPIELLAIKPYQRKRQRHVKAIANNWNDKLCGVLAVSYDEKDWCFNVVDGQHRAYAAKQCGKEYLVCNVYTGLSIHDKAKLFCGQDNNNKKLTPFDTFNANQYIAEKDDTNISRIDKKIKIICDEYGVRVEKSKAVNCLKSVTAARAVVRRGGDEALRYAYDVIQKSGWGRHTDAYNSLTLCELAGIYIRTNGNVQAKNNLIKFFKGSNYKEIVALGNNNYPTLSREERFRSILEDIATDHKINKVKVM